MWLDRRPGPRGCGRLTDNDRFLLKTQPDRVEQIEADLSKLDGRIEQRLKPYQEQHERLMHIPEIDRVTAAVMLAELGADVNAFPRRSALRHRLGWPQATTRAQANAKGEESKKRSMRIQTP